MKEKFVVSLTRRFASAKRLSKYLSESNSKLVEHRAQSPVHEFRLEAWPSITEGFPIARSRDNLYNECDNECEKNNGGVNKTMETEEQCRIVMCSNQTKFT